jgi:hypothetical protein
MGGDYLRVDEMSFFDCENVVEGSEDRIDASDVERICCSRGVKQRRNSNEIEKVGFKRYEKQENDVESPYYTSLDW